MVLAQPHAAPAPAPAPAADADPDADTEPNGSVSPQDGGLVTKPAAASTARPKALAKRKKGFAFITSDQQGRPPSDTRKLIRSHVMRGKNTRKRNPPTASSVHSHTARTTPVTPPDDVSPSSSSPPYGTDEADDAVASMKLSTTTVTLAPRGGRGTLPGVTIHMATIPGPINFPITMWGCNFAENIDHEGRRLMHEFFITLRASLYPMDLCINTPNYEDNWWLWLLSDPAYLNSALFNVSALKDLTLYRRSSPLPKACHFPDIFSPQTWKYFRRTVLLLQERLEDVNDQLKLSTTAVVVSLAMTAELTGDDRALDAHVKGLNKLVRMRGGVDSFPAHSKMQVKTCRVDLGWSLKTGEKPQLRTEKDVSWSQCCPNILIDENLTHIATPSRIQPLIDTMETKLHHIFCDMRSFCCMAIHLKNNDRKLQPHVFQEIMLSLQYRLLLLDYGSDEELILEECLRLTLLILQLTLYVNTPGIKRPYGRINKQLRVQLRKVDAFSPMRADLKLWMLYIGAMLVLDMDDPWLCGAIYELTAGMDWPTVRSRLEGVMWVPFLHEVSGIMVFHAVEAASGQPLSQVQPAT